MNKIPTILLFLGLLLLMACNDPKHVTDTLHRAEALMNEHPDSALTLLQSVSPDEMGQNSTRALHALLYTQAQDKNYIDETNDSLIRIAVDYYRNTDDVRHQFLSYYYQGRVHFNTKDYLNATSCYMEAEQLADAVGDDYLAGLLYAELGRIYGIYYDYPKSLEAYQKAAECYERAGKIRHRNYMLFNQSTVFRNMNQHGESELLLRMIVNLTKEEEGNTLTNLCLGGLVMSCIEQNRISEAKVFYEELTLLVGEGYGSSSFMGKLAQMYAKDQNFVLANECLEKGWKYAESKTDSVCLYIASSEIYSLQGNGKQAYQELMKGVLMQNKDTRQALQQPVLTAQRDYLSEKLEFEVYKLRMRKLLNLVSTLFFLLLLGVLAYVFSRMLKKKKATIDKLGKENQNLLQQLADNKKEADRIVEKLKSELIRKEKHSNAEISMLLQKLECGENSMEELKQKLFEKEANRLEMESLVQKLESDSQMNATALDALRAEMENLQEQNRKMMFQKVELLKSVLEQVAAEVNLYEAKCFKEETKEKRIRESINSLKKDYFAGENEYRKVEALVNLYLDNAMWHFRKEVTLPNEADYRRVCYMFAGVSGQVIGQIMGESKDAVYQRRSRLLKKIASLSCVHKEMFVMLLSK